MKIISISAKSVTPPEAVINSATSEGIVSIVDHWEKTSRGNWRAFLKVNPEGYRYCEFFPTGTLYSRAFTPEKLAEMDEEKKLASKKAREDAKAAVDPSLLSFCNKYERSNRAAGYPEGSFEWGGIIFKTKFSQRGRGATWVNVNGDPSTNSVYRNGLELATYVTQHLPVSSTSSKVSSVSDYTPKSLAEANLILKAYGETGDAMVSDLSTYVGQDLIDMGIISVSEPDMSQEGMLIVSKPIKPFSFYAGTAYPDDEPPILSWC